MNQVYESRIVRYIIDCMPDELSNYHSLLLYPMFFPPVTLRSLASRLIHIPHDS
jgi:hypothetical protein